MEQVSSSSLDSTALIEIGALPRIKYASERTELLCIPMKEDHHVNVRWQKS